MNIQNSKQIQLSEILSYFEKENLGIPKTLTENLNRFFQIIELLKGYKTYLNKVLSTKTIQFQQLEEFLQNIHEIKTFYLDLETIYQNIAVDYDKISTIINEASNLVKKKPYVVEFRTTSFGDYVRGKREAHFYIINHSELISFLNKVKDLVKPVDIYEVQYTAFIVKFKELIDILPFIKFDYLPDVVYANVPEQFERIIILSEELKNLCENISFLETYGFLKEFLDNMVKEVNKIQEYFKLNPDINVLKLRGKFRKVYSNINTLHRALSLESLSL